MISHHKSPLAMERYRPVELEPDRREIRSEMARIRKSWSPAERRWRQRLAQVSQWMLLSAGN